MGENGNEMKFENTWDYPFSCISSKYKGVCFRYATES